MTYLQEDNRCGEYWPNTHQVNYDVDRIIMIRGIEDKLFFQIESITKRRHISPCILLRQRLYFSVMLNVNKVV